MSAPHNSGVKGHFSSTNVKCEAKMTNTIMTWNMLRKYIYSKILLLIPETFNGGKMSCFSIGSRRANEDKNTRPGLKFG